MGDNEDMCWCPFSNLLGSDNAMSDNTLVLSSSSRRWRLRYRILHHLADLTCHFHYPATMCLFLPSKAIRHRDVALSHSTLSQQLTKSSLYVACFSQCAPAHDTTRSQYRLSISAHYQCPSHCQQFEQAIYAGTEYPFLAPLFSFFSLSRKSGLSARRKHIVSLTLHCWLSDTLDACITLEEE